MKIIADENINNVEVFFNLGTVNTIAGRQINAQTVKDADALLVRSITQVDANLLQGSTIKFVASATSGIDHIDLDYLQKNNIAFNYAPGCNANSVVEYVFTALAFLASKKERPVWQECTFGIVGAGNIGGLLARRLRSLGIPYVIYDPLLDSSSEHGESLVSFEEVLEQEVLSIHTPLSKGGTYPSFHMFNAQVIDSLKPGKVLINAARGGVIDNAALLQRLQRFNDLHCILDAWENEPKINLKLLERVDLGTPHIAGYSQEGKLNGTKVIYDALCDFFDLQVGSPFGMDEAPVLLKLNADYNLLTDSEKLNACLLAGYDIQGDYRAMQGLYNEPEPGAAFDMLRKNYPVRKEFKHWRVDLSDCNEALSKQLVQLGFIGKS